MDDLSDERNASPGTSVAVAIGLTVLGLFGAELFTIPAVLLDPALATDPQAVSIELRALFLMLNFVGMAAIGGAYLAVTGRGWAYVDLRVPTLRDALYVLGGAVAVLGAYVVASVLITLLELPAADNQIVQFVDSPTMVLVMIAIVFLFNAPAEEFLFRNVIQKRLAEAFGDLPAIGVASAIFALVHLPVYWLLADSLLATVVPIPILFVGAVVFGYVYVATANLLVPALVHGLYNGFIFSLIYLSMVTDVEDAEVPTSALVDVVAALPW